MLAVRRCLRVPRSALVPLANRAAPVRSVATDDGGENWSDFNNVAKELRNVSREQGLDGAMPETKLLKELGYGSLVHAIRKKHGGVAQVAQKLGLAVPTVAVDEGKRVQARAKRRQKRSIRIAQHDFY